jgi:hypothetical protein
MDRIAGHGVYPILSRFCYEHLMLFLTFVF